MINTMDTTCLYCDEILFGRLGKKFCSPHCRSAYHYNENKHKKDKLYDLLIIISYKYAELFFISLRQKNQA